MNDTLSVNHMGLCLCLKLLQTNLKGTVHALITDRTNACFLSILMYL